MSADRILELEKLISYHDDEYWNNDNTIISNDEYDQLKQELSVLDPQNLLVTKRYNPIHNTVKRKEIIYKNKMLSLKKVYNVESLMKWCETLIRTENESFIIEPKFDGIAVNFENGVLSTSGNGSIGYDISDKIGIINNLPENQNRIGELVILRSVFKRVQSTILKKDGSQYAIERSMVSGIINTDNITFDEKIITFIDYSQFKIAEFKYSHFLNIENFPDKFNELLEKVKQIDYPLDGIVIKLADIHYRTALGNTATDYRGQVAYKFGNPSGITTLKDIIFQCGKKNITPVGIIDNTIINGINNNRITLHNWGYVLLKNIGVGDVIEIERCGEIIPHYKRTIEKNSIGTMDISTLKCPSCQSQLIYNDPNLICSNKTCNGNLIQRFRDGIKRLGIKEFGQKSIETFYDSGIITKFVDIFNIDISQVIKLDRFSIILANKINDEIKRVQLEPIEDYKIFSALSIPGVGDELSKILMHAVHIDELVNFTRETYYKVLSTEKFEQERTRDLFIYIKENKNDIVEMFSMFPKIIHSSIPIQTDNVKPLKLVCFTQDDPSGRSRDELIHLGRKHNYVSQKSVTKLLKLLVCQNKEDLTDKIKKAIKYNVPIVTYEEFEKILNNESISE